MKIESFEVGQHLFQAEIYAKGRPVENCGADQFTTREEAEQDGQIMADSHDPEWQKRNPNCMEVVVREYLVDSVDDDGQWGGHTVD